MKIESTLTKQLKDLGIKYKPNKGEVLFFQKPYLKYLKIDKKVNGKNGQTFKL